MRHVFIFIFLALNIAVYAQQTISLHKGWQFRKSGTTKWFRAEVPGTVHTDLLANKLMPDPFYRDNESKVQWVENEGWEYRTTFDVPTGLFKQKHIEIQFDGLDTYAEVYLNGNKIVSADNMFRQWTANVEKFVKLKGNQLSILFPPQSALAKLTRKADSLVKPENERVYVRKAQYQFGWDWGPRLVTCGIWKDVKLSGWNDVRITEADIIPVNDRLVLKVVIESYIDGLFDLKTTYKGKTAVHEIRLWKGATQFEIPLAETNFSKKSNPFRKDSLTILVQHSKLKTPVKHKMFYCEKTATLITEKDFIGESFLFTVNGKPTFIKGANWIPSESFLPRAKKLKRYEQLIKAAKEANINMLRVWGGGIYEDDVFYDLCDKYGIMVWQDFMFAGALYPADDAFLKNIEEEVRYQVKRLRHHPSIVLWCGNNEIEEAWFNWGWQKQFNYSKEDSMKLWDDYKKIFHELIPGILKELDPQRPYWPSSPSLGWGTDSAYKKGDVHYWGVWWGKEPVEKYNEKVGRFVSEYGMQGIPDMKTIRQFSVPMDWNTSSAVMRTHQKHPFGWENIKYYIDQKFRTPKSFEDLVYVSQLMQADAIKTAIEAHRRNKPTTMGTMFWQWNDCWPVTSWSAIDYYGRKKALYYEVKRSFAPVAISCSVAGNSLTIDLIADEMKLENITVHLDSYRWENLLASSVSPKKYFVSPDSVMKLTIPLLDEEMPADGFAKLYIEREGKILASQILFFSKPATWILPKPTIRYVIKNDRLELTSNKFAYGVYINVPDGVELQDNYFHLLPGEKKAIKFSSSIPIEQLKKLIRIKSLVDTY